MIEIIDQLEARVGKLIEELETLRVTKIQLETENDGLKITLADYEQVRAEVEALRARAPEAQIEPGSEVDQLWTELQALSDERDALKAALAEGGAGPVELAEERRRRHEAEKQLDSLRAEKQAMERRLRDAERRDAQMRERLTRMIERIESTETYLAQVELIHENA